MYGNLLCGSDVIHGGITYGDYAITLMVGVYRVLSVIDWGEGNAHAMNSISVMSG